jgi:hypothetical protein
VIDDGEDLSRSGTPKPAMTDEKGGAEAAASADGSTQDNNEKAAPADGQAAEKSDASATPKAELTPEIRTKLRKLEKLEATYPGTKLSHSSGLHQSTNPYSFRASSVL